jgi:hypothetical protein
MLKIIMDNMVSILVSWITCYPGYSVTWAFIDCLRSSRGSVRNGWIRSRIHGRDSTDGVMEAVHGLDGNPDGGVLIVKL